MVVCKYWKQGNCRNGSSCRFEHPSNAGTTNNINNGNNNNRGGFGGQFGALNRPERWQLNEDDIKNDLSVTTPKWILSAYGPGKDPPISLFKDNEFSPEEIRWRFYSAQANGTGDQADREAIQAWQKAQAEITEGVKNIRGIQDFMLQKEKEHPNRYDFCKMDGKISAEEHANNSKMNSIPGSSMNPFGANQQTTSSANPFSKPAFGQSSSPFGQVSSNSPFAKPAQPAQPSAFGKPAFGQTSFGQPAAPQSGFGQSGFGQTSTPGSAFGGKPAGAAPGFGQTSSIGANATANPFGKPSAAGGFGQPAFGQAAGATATPFGQTPGTTASPFGQAPSTSTGFGQGSGTTASPFGGAAASASPFSQPQQTTLQSALKQNDPAPANPFGKAAGFATNPFNQPAQPAGQSPFGQGAQAASPNPFGGTQPSQPAPSGFGVGTGPGLGTGFGNGAQPAKPSPFGQPQAQTQPTTTPSPFTQPPQQSTNPTTATTSAPLAPNRSALTTNPTRPLHYTQTLPQVAATFDSRDRPITYRGLQVQNEVRTRAEITGEEVFDHEIFKYKRPDGRGEERIWFPKGSADIQIQRLPNALLDFQCDEHEYTDVVKDSYRKLFETGAFEAGKMPLVPPMREWLAYDI